MGSWYGVLIFMRTSFTDGCRCYQKMLIRGEKPPWGDLFDILLSPRWRFESQEPTFQENIIRFLNEHVDNIPCLMMRRFALSLPDYQQTSLLLEKAVPDSETHQMIHSSQKRKLASPEIPQSKCAKPAEPLRPPMSSSLVDDAVGIPKVVSIVDLLSMEPSEFSQAFNDFSFTINATDVNAENVGLLLDRAETSLEIFRRSVLCVVTCYLQHERACSRSTSGLMKRILTQEGFYWTEFGLSILRTCSKLVVEGFAKLLVSLKCDCNDLLFHLHELKSWNENVTSFLTMILNDTLSHDSLEKTLSYLLSYSDTSSSKTCTLVIKILQSTDDSNEIHSLCAKFVERNNSFLKKALLQMLDQ